MHQSHTIGSALWFILVHSCVLFSKTCLASNAESAHQAHYCIQWPAIAESQFAHERDWLIRFAEWLPDGSKIYIFRVNSLNLEKLFIEKRSDNMDDIRDILLSLKPAGIGREVSAEQLNANLLECFPKANSRRYTPDMAEIFMIIGQTNLDITNGFRDTEIKMYAIIFGEVVNKDWLPFVTDVNHVISASNEALLYDSLIKDTNKRCRKYEYYQTSIPKGCTSCTNVCNDGPRYYCTYKGFEEECEYLLDLWRRQAITTSTTSTTQSSNINQENGSSGGSDSKSKTVIIMIIVIIISAIAAIASIAAFIAASVKNGSTIRQWIKNYITVDKMDPLHQWN
ncbi:uncharacterized protein LOC128234679 [Mya arenaria]|uniref:uncharacterized protein LOC128234679 n=1 Tax=Mya arenaria TaxID=6604 RepID=UPI0022E0A16A|nr:uncharacterized protein LOC128234679 [Mya arenaria]